MTGFWRTTFWCLHVPAARALLEIGVEEEDQETELVSSISEQLMIATGGFHADAAVR